GAEARAQPHSPPAPGREALLRDLPDARVAGRRGGVLLRAHPVPRRDRFHLRLSRPSCGLPARKADPRRRLLPASRRAGPRGEAGRSLRAGIRLASGGGPDLDSTVPRSRSLDAWDPTSPRAPGFLPGSSPLRFPFRHRQAGPTALTLTVSPAQEGPRWNSTHSILRAPI